MRKVTLLMVFLATLTSFAKSKSFEYKHWEIFRSDWGYEFKYPSCWVVRVDNSDESQALTPSTKSISISETDKCRRPQMAAYVPNGISMDYWQNIKSAAAQAKYFQRMTKSDAPIWLARGDWKFYKRVKLDGHDEEVWVEDMKDVHFYEYRWHLDIYCGSRKFSFYGPTIKNAGPAYEKKFKSGDNALPEPEKTIYASIRCIKPKK